METDFRKPLFVSSISGFCPKGRIGAQVRPYFAVECHYSEVE